jgi:hypothetical protein
MITRFKIFENNNKPQVGDYVKVNASEYEYDNNLMDFFENNFGKIIEIQDDSFGAYLVKFDEKFKYTVPTGHYEYTDIYPCGIDEIEYWDSDLERLKIKVETSKDVNKYNL